MKIIMAGGMTGGPVSPLIAIANKIRETYPDSKFILIDQVNSVGQQLADKNQIVFQAVYAGKLKRYWSLSNLFAPFLTIIGFFQALFLILKLRPDIAIGAGGYVQVPVLWAAWLCRVPVLIHQQDIHPGLANLLCASIAKKITVTFSRSVAFFPEGLTPFIKNSYSKIVVTGNPVRQLNSNLSRAEALAHFKLKNTLPIVLIFGGGSGAAAINELIEKSLPDLSKVVQIIHATGKNRSANQSSLSTANYKQYQFIDRMDFAYKAADLVVARAGVSTIAELAELGKLAVIIPMPATHQESNAQYLCDKQAAVILDQTTLKPKQFVQSLRTLLIDGSKQQRLVSNMNQLLPKQASEKIAKIIVGLISKK